VRTQVNWGQEIVEVVKRIAVKGRTTASQPVPAKHLPKSFDDWIAQCRESGLRKRECQALQREAERLGLDPIRLLRDSTKALRGLNGRPVLGESQPRCKPRKDRAKPPAIVQEMAQDGAV
jgi:hypothetical protein